MSKSAAPASLEVKPSQRISRTRHQSIGANRKSVYVVLICVTLCIVGALASRSYARGSMAFVFSNAPDASIQLDQGFGVTNASGFASVGPLPYGAHSLRIVHRDYQPISTSISLGWLSGNRFSFQLIPIPLTLRINTMPGAQILLDDQSAGTANGQGVFIKPGVMPGYYRIQVRHAGYSPFILAQHLSPPVAQIDAGLKASQ
jgi:hypothetical protein